MFSLYMDSVYGYWSAENHPNESLSCQALTSLSPVYRTLSSIAFHCSAIIPAKTKSSELKWNLSDDDSIQWHLN